MTRRCYALPFAPGVFLLPAKNAGVKRTLGSPGARRCQVFHSIIDPRSGAYPLRLA